MANGSDSIPAAQLKKLLTECEERYERLVEGSQDVIFRMRVYPDVAFEYINPVGERLFGRPLEERYSVISAWSLSRRTSQSSSVSLPSICR